jgi:hypothetical protein
MPEEKGLIVAYRVSLIRLIAYRIVSLLVR